jgi:hypothetical protein
MYQFYALVAAFVARAAVKIFAVSEGQVWD